MGNSSYSYSARSARSDAKGFYKKSMDEVFTQQKERKIHESMSPKGVAKREARDSETHPNTVPVILNLDVTGSMMTIPDFLVKDGLPKMMGGLIQNGIPDATLLFTAIGDHECDRFPLQIGQFESGDEELDLWLTRTYLEKGGGGNAGESYLLAYYFAAFHTDIDAYSKRGQRGFLFTVGDEPGLKSLPGRAIMKSWEQQVQKPGAIVSFLQRLRRCMTFITWYSNTLEELPDRSLTGKIYLVRNVSL